MFMSMLPVRVRAPSTKKTVCCEGIDWILGRLPLRPIPENTRNRITVSLNTVFLENEPTASSLRSTLSRIMASKEGDDFQNAVQNDGMAEKKDTTLSSTPAADARYRFDADRLQTLQSAAPWMKDPRYFQKVTLSPSAIMKIMMHCQSGVQKGIAKGGNPIEVMGMLLGRPDPDTPRTLVITDAFPLPIEGFETRVIADDENVVNHMIALGESLERTRKEKFMGWYHSHPFDLGDHSHCFLSQTDLSTQLQWQRAEDPHGNPFVAIVVDPLRSHNLETPELKAFRAYPPEYVSPALNECPDGSVESSEQTRLEHWGSCWNRYYELSVEYYMSSTSRNVLQQLTQDYLWIRTLSRKSESSVTQRLCGCVKPFQSASLTAASVVSGGRGTGLGPGGSTSASVSSGMDAQTKEWQKAVSNLADIASEDMGEQALQSTKEQVFA